MPKIYIAYGSNEDYSVNYVKTLPCLKHIMLYQINILININECKK